MEINPELATTESEKKDAETEVENKDFAAVSMEIKEDFTAVFEEDGGGVYAESEVVNKDFTAVFEEDSDYNLDLWRALVGNRPYLPKKDNLAVYFPQGHLEYAALITSSLFSSSEVPNFNLQPEIFCRVQHVQLIANKTTDEACAHVTLLPEQKSEGQNPKGEEVMKSGVNKAKAALRMFSVTLSKPEDLRTISIPVDAYEVFIPLWDLKLSSQVLSAEDVQGTHWKFYMEYEDSQRKYQIRRGWTEFVRRKRLNLKDTVAFLRFGDWKLRLGIKRFGCECGVPMFILANYYQCSKVLSRVANATIDSSLINLYHIRLHRADFIKPYQKYMESITRWGIIGIKFETMDALSKRCSGVVTGISELDPFIWPNSEGKCLMVSWDNVANEKPVEEAVSPWEIVRKVLSSSDSIIDISPKLKKPRTVSQLNTSLHDPAGSAFVLFDEEIEEREKQASVMVQEEFQQKEFPIKHITDIIKQAPAPQTAFPEELSSDKLQKRNSRPRKLNDFETDSHSSLASSRKRKSATVVMPTHLKISKRLDQEILLDPMVYNSLKYLEFDSCLFHSPTLLHYFPTTLKTFKVTNCINSEHVLHLLMDQKDWSLEFLEVDGCSSLVSLPIHKLPTTIRQINISNCTNLKSLGESLDNEKHDSVGSDPATNSDISITTLTTVISQLRALVISDCEELEFLPEGLHNLIHLELLAISNCSSLVTFPQGGLPKNSLTSFLIHGCENLKYLPRQFHEVTSLENLDVRNCHCLMSFPEGGLPPNLVSLRVVDCQNLNPPSQWGLHKLKHLRNYAFIDGRRNRGK